MTKKCIVCNKPASGTRIMGGIEAAFCEQHFPVERILITVRC